ncbi:MAG: hypothetical protein HW383_207 [Candidatus Magasanikbacteria bacterium]|nr:hypothetical protein [Candidatus Magasanikbacteria bacterium]
MRRIKEAMLGIGAVAAMSGGASAEPQRMDREKVRPEVKSADAGLEAKRAGILQLIKESRFIEKEYKKTLELALNGGLILADDARKLVEIENRKQEGEKISKAEDDWRVATEKMIRGLYGQK